MRIVHQSLGFAGLVGFLLAAHPAVADCVCTCVNGVNQALCSSAIDLRPICPPKVCPIAPSSVQPIMPPTVPPVGTSVCWPEMVQNPYTGLYEWRQVCR